MPPARSLAGRFVAEGVVKGDRLGLLAPNGTEWAAVALAAMRIGAVLVPLSTLLRPPELLAQLTTASVSHLVASAEFRGRRHLGELDAVAPGLLAAVRPGGRHPAAPSLRRVWTTDEIREGTGRAELVPALEARVGPADDMVVLFTSGSRGAPKGVIHTHGAALRAVAAGLEARCVHPGERLYIPMPFFWTGGFGQGLLTVLVAGATLLTEAEPEPERTLAAARARAGHPLPGVAGPSGPPGRATRFRRGGSVVAARRQPARRPAGGAAPRTRGEGQPVRDDRDVRPLLRRPLGHGSATREVRELWPAVRRRGGAHRRPRDGTPASGRREGRDPAARYHLMRGICGRVRSDVFEADGSYRTGDLGHVDEDGYLWYSGRLDDMVKVKGATVYPSEVEAALRSISEVTQAFVTDVPDAAGRPEIAALVITDAPLEVVRGAVKGRLSAFKVPTRWLVRDALDEVPLMGSGKVDKAALQRLLAREGSEAAA